MRHVRIRNFIASRKGAILRSSMLIALSLATYFGSQEYARAANGSVAYTYDALGRVNTASYDTGVIVMYSYDANGNRTQQVVNVNTGAMCWGTVAGICTTATWGAGLWHS